MIRRRAAPDPPPRAHAAAPPPVPRQAPPPLSRPRRAARKRPTCGPGGPARGNARPPGNGPRWPGKAAVSAAGSTASCAPPAPRGGPRRRKHSWPRPAPPVAPRECAAPPPRRPAGPRPGTPTRQAPRRPPGWPCPRGVPPGGSQSLGATGWRPRPPLTQKKPQSNGGLTPPGKDGEADGQGWHCPGWTACRLRA